MASSAGDLTLTPNKFGKQLFPSEVDGKINTLEFLEASRGIVKLVDKFGKAFSPISNDISSNIEKIKKCYEKNPSKYVYIEDMILSEKSENNVLSVDALLWLRRALHFILIFFENIINDGRKNECLKEHIVSAYSQTLEPYHGWVTRKLFQCLKNLVPNRSHLLNTIDESNGKDDKENLLKFLQVYIESLAKNVYHIMSFYKDNNLDCDSKV